MDSQICNHKTTSIAAGEIAWYSGNSNTKPERLTDLKLPNGWWLYNMAGSVQEWCHDAYKKDLGFSAVTNPAESPATIKDIFGVARGGSFAKDIGLLRAAHRAKLNRNQRLFDVGLRCVRTLLPAPDAGPADAAVDAGGPGG
jgi:formylglycine-generating enzyme required for sulfatase activity